MNLIDVKENNNNNKYRVSCIYGIYVNKELIYIGKTKNAISRWVTHKHHIVKDESNCRACYGDFYPIYIRLRNDYINNKIIEFKILEEASISELSKKEKEYIERFNLPLNIKKY